MLSTPHRRTTTYDDLSWIADTSGDACSDNRSQREVYRRILYSAIETQLPPKQREALELYYLQGHTIYQIAEQLRVHPSTVSRRISAARRTIQSFAQGCLHTGLVSPNRQMS